MTPIIIILIITQISEVEPYGQNSGLILHPVSVYDGTLWPLRIIIRLLLNVTIIWISLGLLFGPHPLTPSQAYYNT